MLPVRLARCTGSAAVADPGPTPDHRACPIGSFDPYVGRGIGHHTATVIDPRIARQFHDLCNLVWAIQVEAEFALATDPECGAAPELLEIHRKATEALVLLRSATALHGLTMLGRPDQRPMAAPTPTMSVSG